MITKEEGIRKMLRFAFSDDDGDPDLTLLPELAAALKKAEQRAITDAVRWLYDNGHKSAAVALEARDKR